MDIEEKTVEYINISNKTSTDGCTSSARVHNSQVPGRHGG